MSSRIAFVKIDNVGSAMSTYTVLLDDRPVGAVSKVRDRYLRRLGGHRGNNVHAARDAWAVEGDRFRSKYDTRAEAVVVLVAETQNIDMADALDIVRSKV